ncbi:MAG: tungstate transport system ATP-binding protein [Rhodospirillaceae bacterium]|nr:tungstate transport system ATP-binding protein [Rhodospirillaceae bacterium]
MTAAALPLELSGVVWEAGGQRRLDGIDLTIEAGARTVILGPNGAGKSLLLRICHGLLTASAGSVRWRGPAAEEAPWHQAMVFQRPVMLRRSAAANIDYALKLRRMPANDRRQKVAAALARTGLSALADQPARLLSIGEQQRLALARAWATEPELLLLDEPTASLDPAATFAVEAIIEAMHCAGCKIVMSTHDLAQARRLADEIVFLHRGRVCERQPASRFFSKPATPEAEAFVAGTLHW